MGLEIVRCGFLKDGAGDYIKKMQEIPKEKKVILIVPDQYSFMAEKKMSEIFGGTGLNNKFVYTFSQMKRTFLNINEKLYIKQSGKNMLIRHGADKAIDEDSVFYASKNSPGFLENLNTLLLELKRYCVTSDMLKKSAENTDNKILKNKLITIAGVFDEFQRLLDEGQFLDAEDDYARLAEEISNNGYFCDAYVWVDMFTDFSPQHLGVLSAILNSGAKMTVYLPATTDGGVVEDSILEFPEKTVSVLRKIAEKKGADYSENVLTEERKVAPAIRAFLENYEKPGFLYKDSADMIRLFEAKEKYSEVEAQALKICDLVKEDKMKFSDIAVVCADLDEYISFIEPIFYEYHIPYFADYKVLMSEHPISLLLSSLFEMVDKGAFLKDSCTRYLRTGFILSDRDVDSIENHIIKCGIRGNMWKNPKYWSEEKKVFDAVTGKSVKYPDNGYLESLRERIMTPVLKFAKATEGKKTVRQMCEALFAYFLDIKLYDKISKAIDAFLNEQRENEGKRYEQVWNFLVEIAEQAVVALGDVLVTREEFYKYLEFGMQGAKISIIPPITDGVAVADAERGVTDEIKALFVLGAVKGEFPKQNFPEGILSDDEREALEFEVAPTRERSGVMSEFKAVMLLSKATEYLSISYPVSDISGSTMEASEIYSDIKEKFPNALVQNNLVSENELLYISSPEATIHKLLLKMSEDGELNPLWENVRSWYERNGGYEEKLRILDIAKEYKSRTARLSEESAKALYEDYTNYSISRIEKYFQCPFGYFLNNGLKLKECEPWKIGGTDTGDLLHWAVYEYCKKVDGDTDDAKVKKENWNRLTDDDSKAIIAEIMDRADATMEFSEYREEQTKNVLGKIRQALEKSVKVVNLSMQNGKYTGAGYEVEFSEKEIKNSDGTVKIKGIIDRVDIYEDFDEGKAYIRIIDYKSGEKGYSRERILNKVDLQLMVYAIAAVDLYKEKAFSGLSGELEPVVKGVFYDKINKNLIECDYSEGFGAEDLWLQNSKLDGRVFSPEIDEGKTKYIDSKDAFFMDYELEQMGVSRFLKVKTKSKGPGLDSRIGVEKEHIANAMMRHVRDSLVEADNNIKSGDIEVSPYKHGAVGGACQYCPYSAICAPDIENCGITKREKSEQQIIEEITGGEM